eukprot:s481_g7.t1
MSFCSILTKDPTSPGGLAVHRQRALGQRLQPPEATFRRCTEAPTARSLSLRAGAAGTAGRAGAADAAEMRGNCAGQHSPSEAALPGQAIRGLNEASPDFHR